MIKILISISENGLSSESKWVYDKNSIILSGKLYYISNNANVAT